MTEDILKKAHLWLTEAFDEATRNDVKNMIEHSPAELEDAFYRNLEFGTGGLRGVMGAGTNRINRYTIGMATQGFANYIKELMPRDSSLSVAVAYDCRNNSSYFAKVTAGVFAANAFKIYLYDTLRTTPQLSFTIRELRCVAGVMITASHNPPEYNGYKVYWSDGAQVTSPHDKNIIDCVLQVDDPSKVKFDGGEEKITTIGSEMDQLYLNSILSLTLSRELVKQEPTLKIVFSPIHGTGVRIVPEALRRMGFTNIFNVPQQDITDGNFPTVKYPNPEEHEALKMALDKAEEVDAQLVMATDPDGDRLGVAVRDDNNRLVLLNGNQTASLLTYYLLERMTQKGLLNRENSTHYYMVKTIVTTDLLTSISQSYGVEMFNVLTGFKYIAGVVKSLEGKRVFIGGGEESYGFNAGEFVRDKDAVISCCLVAEAAVWAKSRGTTLYGLLKEIYLKFGLYKEHMVSLTKKGKEGQERIMEIMSELRSTPPESLNGYPVVLIHDYLRCETTDMVSDLRYKTGLPKSDVLQFICSDNTIVSVRPSGTEPKIKFYFGVRAVVSSYQQLEEAEIQLDKKIEKLSARMLSY